MVTKTNPRPLWRKELLTLSLLISLISVHVSAAPSDTASSPESLKYVVGKTYQYSFESQSVTELSGTSSEKSAVEIKGDALLAVTQDDFVLTLQNVRLATPSGKTLDKVAGLEGSYVRFHYSNGQITQFRVSNSDPVWSVNIKRAVASLLVNHAVVNPNVPRVQYLEDDVSGHDCPTDYVISANGLFKKSRDLNRCARRDGGYSFQFGVPYKLHSGPSNLEIKSDTTVDSDQTFEQEFEDGILKSTKCTETHRVTILNKGESGARATISSSLKLVSTQDGTPTAQSATETRPCTIHFAHITGVQKGDKATSISTELLNTLCTQVGDGVLGDQTAETFLRLKKVLKEVPENKLQELEGKIRSGEICKNNEKLLKLFSDAVASSGSSDSISYIANLISAGKASRKAQRLFRIYTAFADKPTEKALLSVKSLIERDNVDPRLFLTASGLARQYYRHKGAAAETSGPFVAISDEIAKSAEANCRSGDEESQKKAVSALQALGNLNILSSNAVKAITFCLAGSNQIKVHALQAFRSDSCEASLRAEAKKILENKLQPSNVRIHAYLAFAQCQSPEDSSFYSRLVENEDTLQVLAFLKSHRENLYNSRDGHKYSAPEADLFSPNKNPLLEKTLKDARKFSQNLDYSSFDDADTFTGYKSDVNLIYAPDSFLPKTISGNFSVDLYGNTFNVLEVGVNVGDFDSVFENLFGPQGDFPTFFDEKEKRKRRRGKRAAGPVINKNELEVFQNEVKIEHEDRERSDVFLRIFGTTILAKTFDLQDILSESGSYNFGDSVVNAVKGAADIDFTEPFPLYGDELNIPTASGLPLIVQVEGSAIFSLQVKNDLSEDLKVYKPRFAPSASIENKMKLTLGSEILEAGFGVDTTLHAAIDVSAKGLLNSETEGKFSYDLSLTIPKDKLTILDLSNELYWLEEFGTDNAPTKRPFVFSTEQKVLADKCSKAARSILSLDACYSSKVTSGRGLPHFPLSGPAKIAVTLAKVEPSKPYELNLKLQLATSAPYSFLVSLDTPGSEKNRKTELKGSYSETFGEKNVQKLELSLDSPSRKLSASSVFEFNGKLGNGVERLRVSVDEAVYGTDVHVTFKQDDGKTNAALRAELIIHRSSPVEIFNFKATGETVTGPDAITKTRTFDHVVGGPGKSVFVTASGTVTSSRSSSTGALKEASFKDVQVGCNGARVFLLNGQVHGELVDLSTSFRVGESDHDLKIKGKVSSPEANRKVFSGSASSTSLRLLNAEVELDRTAQEGLHKATLKVKQGGEPLVDFHRLVATSANSVQYGGGLKVVYPPGLTHEVSFDRLLDDEKYHLSYDVALGRKVVTSGELNVLLKERTYDLKAKVKIIEQFISFSSTRSKASRPGEALETFQHSLRVDDGPSFKLDTKVYQEISEKVIWKKRVSQISSSLLDGERTLIIKYDVDEAGRSKLRTTGSGTVDIDVKKGSEKRVKFLISSQVPKVATEDFKVNLELFAVNKVDGNLNLVIAQSKKNLFDLSGRLSLPKSGCTTSLKTNLVTNRLTEEPTKSTQFTFDLKLDEGKSSAKSFYYFADAETTNDEKALIRNSKSQIAISGKTYEVNTKLTLAKSVSGDHSISVHVRTPSKQDYHVDLAANLQNDATTKFGTFVLNITTPEEGKLTLNLAVGFKNLNIRNKELQFSTKYELTREGVTGLVTKQGKKYPAFEIFVNTQPHNGKQALELHYSEGGVYYVTPVHHNLNGQFGAGEFGINYRGGDDERADTLVDISIKKSETPLKTYVVGLVFDKAVQGGEAPDLKAGLTFNYRYVSLTDFEFNETFELETNNESDKEKNIKGSAARRVKVVPDLIDIFSEYTVTRGSQGSAKDHSLKLYLAREEKKVTGVFELHDKALGHLTRSPLKTDASVNFEMSRDYPNLHLTLTGKFPNFDFQNFHLKVDHDKRNNGQVVRNTTVTTKLDDFQITLVSNLENAPARMALDWTLNLNNDPPRKLTLVYTEAAQGPSIEAFVQWDNGKQLRSSGSLEKSETGFDAKFDLDSPNLINKWKIAVSRQAEPLKRGFRISAESPDTQEILSFSYDKKENVKTGKLSLNGNAKVKLNVKQKLNLSGGLELLVDKQYYDAGRTVTGRSASAKVIFQNDKKVGNFSIEAATSETAKLVHILTCSLPDNCLDINAQLSQEKGKEAYQGSVTKGSLGAGVSLEITTSDDRKTRVRSLRVFQTESGNTKEVKLKVYRKPGTATDFDLSTSTTKFRPTTISNRGIEIEVAGRTLEGVITKGTSDNVDGASVEVSLRLDSANKPNQKVVLAWSKVGASVNEEGQGQDINLGFRHYLLQRDLRASVNYRYGITNKVFEITSEVDVFSKEEDRLVLSAQLNHDTPATFQVILSANSEGQGLSLSTDCQNIKIEEPNLSFTCDFGAKTGGNERKFSLNYVHTDDQKTIELKNKERFFFYKRSLKYNHIDVEVDEPNVKRSRREPHLNIELQLPGMPDSRILEYKATFPFTVSLKSSRSSSGPEDFFELWLGATRTQAFGLGAIRSSKGGRVSLLDFEVAKIRKQLSVRVDWERQAITDKLDEILNRIKSTKDGLVQFTQETFDTLEDTAQGIRASFSKSAQDFEPLRQHYETLVNTAGKSVGLNTDISLRRASSTSRFLPSLKNAIISGLNCGYDGFEHLVQFEQSFLNSLAQRESFPSAQSTSRRVAAVHKAVQSAAQKIRELIEQGKPIKEKYPVVQTIATKSKLREKLVDKLKNVYSEIQDDLDDLFPYPEVKNFLRDFVDYFEEALLQHQEKTSEQKAEILSKLDKAVEQILNQTVAVDYSKGRAVLNIPLLHRANKIKSLFRCEQEEDDPITDFLERLARNPREVLPPVHATAFVLSTAHYVTFDGKLGRFDKTCQYLLAADFVGKNFSVVIDLGNDNSATPQSLSVTDGQNTVSIGYEEVFVDGRSHSAAFAPSRVGSFKLREEFGWFIVSSEVGVTVGCQVNRAFSDHDHLCAIQVSGFYHGKIQGVLGVYDNELKDEYKLPTGQVTENNAVFVKSWKLNKQCQGKSNWNDILPKYNSYYESQRFDIDTFFTKTQLRKFGSAETQYGLSGASSFSGGKLGTSVGILFLLSFIRHYFVL